jgi:hypothetical protein
MLLAGLGVSPAGVSPPRIAVYAVLDYFGPIVAAFGSGFAGGFTGAVLATGSLSAALTAGLMSSVTAGLLGTVGAGIANVVVGCVGTRSSGNCGRLAAAEALEIGAQFVAVPGGGGTNGVWGTALSTVEAGVVGGIEARITGGSFNSGFSNAAGYYLGTNIGGAIVDAGTRSANPPTQASSDSSGSDPNLEQVSNNRGGTFERGGVFVVPPAPDETKLDPAGLNIKNPLTLTQQDAIVETFNDLETGDYVANGQPIKIFYNFPSYATGAQLPTDYTYVEFRVQDPSTTSAGAWRLVIGVSTVDNTLPFRIYFTNTHYNSFYRIILYPGGSGGS